MHLLVVSHPCVTPVNQKFYAEVQRQTGWDLTVVTPASWKSKYGYRSPERWPGFSGTLRPIPVWFSGNVPLHIYRSLFFSLLREVNPDVIYLHHEPYAAATAQVYLANRMSLQCPIGFFTWQNIEKTYPPPFRYLEQMVYRRSDYAICGSESAQAVLRSKGYSGPTSTIPAAIDPDRFSSSDEAHDPFALDLPDSTVLIGYAGRIVEQKGLHTFLDALAQRRDLPWHFVLIGDGDFVEPLQSQAKRLNLRDRLSFLGYVDHSAIPPYLSALDLVVLPSETQPNWKEQFGRIIVEALAAGTPVLGSDSGEIPHVIERTDGGITFSEGDAAACARQLDKLVRDDELRCRLARRGQSYVTSNYTHHRLAQSFVETIRTVR
jgi:glycosyltransferase involved in cell wall biosynthesis